MSGSQELPQEQEPKHTSRRRPYGACALILWGLAAVCSTVDALLFYDRIKVLLLSGGLLMMDIAGAVLASLIWYLDKYRLGPLANYQAALEYGYRAGQIAHRSRRQSDMHVVLPMQQRPRDVIVSNGTGHTED